MNETTAIALGFALFWAVCLLLHCRVELHASQLRILHERVKELEKTLERLAA